MPLRGEQSKRLHRALMSAFPRRTDLAQMVRFRLDENLETIAAGGSLSDLTFGLITWAEAAGRTQELVAGALAEQPRNPDMQSFAAELGLATSAAPIVALGTPGRGKAGILVDLSHEQSRWGWGKDTIFSAAKGRLAPLLQPSQDPSWDLREVSDRRQLSAGALQAWSGLLLGIPCQERIEDVTCYEIVKWVREGGRLALLGYELGERHHQTNLNDLAGEFGLRFNADIVAPAGWQQKKKPYDTQIDFMNVQSVHPVMSGVRRLCLRGVCTLTIEPGADILLTVGKNGVCWLQKEDAFYDRGWLRTPAGQEFEVFTGADWVPVIAEAPQGLTGSGKVLAVGTWKLFGPNFDFPSGSDNRRFVTNLLDWFGGRI